MHATTLSDLTAEVFLALKGALFGANGNPVPFPLREKRNTQDDPFDEYLQTLLSRSLPGGTQCIRSPGPLITPDLVVMRPNECNGAPRAALATDVARIVAIEVKKLERTRSGAVARASGLDYNTTPPCGTVRVYDTRSRPLDIRGFYLFVCQEPMAGRAGQYQLTALALCDGNLLNADFEYYLSIVGERTKEIGLGTYADGANRTRPMLIFANPLGVAELDQEATLLHPRGNLEVEFNGLVHVGTVSRTAADKIPRTFHCYRRRDARSAAAGTFELHDPFPTPERTEQTQPRGRFRLEIQPSD